MKSIEHSFLQGNQFNPGSAFQDSAGKIFFGGTNGFTVIQPSGIKSNPLPPVPFLTKLIINNSEMLASHAGSPLQSSITETKEIKLKPCQILRDMNKT